MPPSTRSAVGGEAIDLAVELVDERFDEIGMHELLAEAIENASLEFVPTDT